MDYGKILQQQQQHFGCRPLGVDGEPVLVRRLSTTSHKHKQTTASTRITQEDIHLMRTMNHLSLNNIAIFFPRERGGAGGGDRKIEVILAVWNSGKGFLLSSVILYQIF
jgi:hypothetical protein